MRAGPCEDGTYPQPSRVTTNQPLRTITNQKATGFTSN